MPPKKNGKHSSQSAELLLGRHWAIQPEALDALRAAIEKSHIDPAAISSKQGEWLERTRSVSVRDGVATLPVRGTLTRYWDFWGWFFGGGSNYEELARDFSQALEDPAVRAIVLDVDSHGGETNGMVDCAALFAAGRGKKPIVAHVGGNACSAAYLLASAADAVNVSPIAILGSIGTVWSYYDYSKLEKSLGIKHIELVSSQSPKKRVDVRTAEGQAEVIAVLDALADVFIRDVATYRGVSPETVISDFGQGGVFVGSAAVDAGLADQIATLEQVHQELAAASAPRVFTLSAEARRMTAKATDPMKVRAEGDSPPDDEDKKKKDDGEEEEEGKKKKGQHDDDHMDDDDEDEEDEDTPEGRDRLAAKFPVLTAHLRIDGAKAERERLTAIDALAGPGLEKVIAECKADATCSAGDAALRVIAAQRSATAKENSPGALHVAALKKDEQNLDVPSGAAGQQADSETAATVKRIVGLHNSVRGPATARRN